MASRTRHPPYEGTSGKEETFRVRQGVVYLHIEDREASLNPKAHSARAERGVYSAANEIVLNPGGAVHDTAEHEALVPGRT